MNWSIQMLGASVIAFPLIWFFAGRRGQIAGRQKMAMVLAGIVITAGLCGALRYASQVLFGEFVIDNPGSGLQVVFFLGAPLGFAFVVVRLIRPLNPEAVLVDQASQVVDPGHNDGDASSNLPVRR